MGVDCLELDSPRQSGFDNLIKYKEKIAFMTSVNIQTVYPKGTTEEVEQEVIEMIKTFSTQNGGYLAFFYTDIKAIKAPKENVKAYKRALKKWGKYPLNLLEQ